MENNNTHWWKIIPTIPSRKTSWQYKTLRRIWFDHTMCGGRGIYNLKSEDCLTVLLFNNWTLFPNNDWCKKFLNACNVNTSGEIEKIRWSFGFEEYLQNESRRPIADIVIKWKDEIGEGILIIEVKKKGLRSNSLNEKDIPSSSIYLQLPSIKKYKRKSACLLIDEEDLENVRKQIGENEPIITWQKMASLQIEFAQELNIPDSVKEFVVGSLLNSYAENGIFPTPLPYYLESEPSIDEIRKNKSQLTQERQVPYWEF